MPDQHDHTHHGQPAEDLAESSSVIGVPADLLEALGTADPDQARAIEEASVAATDNGWQEGDPLEQPENPEPWTGEEPA